MTLADVLAVISGLAIVGAGFACLSVILAMLMPNAVERAGTRAAERPGRSLALGLLVFLVVLVVLSGLMKSGGAGPVLAVALLLMGLSLAVLGGAALSARLGRRCRGATSGPSSLDDLLRGVFLLEGAALLPIVGWFVVLPSAFFVSLGAGFHAMIRRRTPQVLEPAPVPQA